VNRDIRGAARQLQPTGARSGCAAPQQALAPIEEQLNVFVELEGCGLVDRVFGG
jgi:hypothetical protein